jgi:hypothetical protein
MPIASRSAPMAAVYAVKGWGSLWMRVMISVRMSFSSAEIWSSRKVALHSYLLRTVCGPEASRSLSSLAIYQYLPSALSGAGGARTCDQRIMNPYTATSATR